MAFIGATVPRADRPDGKNYGSDATLKPLLSGGPAKPSVITVAPASALTGLTLNEWAITALNPSRCCPYQRKEVFSVVMHSFFFLFKIYFLRVRKKYYYLSDHPSLKIYKTLAARVFFLSYRPFTRESLGW